MDDELKSIEIETARIRMERERLALQDDLDRRKRNAKVADVSQTVMETTLAAGGVATDAALTATKLVSKAIFGSIVAGVLSLAWVAAHQWKGDFGRLMWDYGYWMGSSGFVFILVCAIGYPLFTSGGVGTSGGTQATAVVAPSGPSIFERKATLRRQIKFWLITCAVTAGGFLIFSMRNPPADDPFGWVLLPLMMAMGALPFWAIGLVMDFLRIFSTKRR